MGMGQRTEDRCTIMDAQVRDVIRNALLHYVDLLDGRADLATSCGDPREAATICRQWARARAVQRLVERED